MDKVVLAYSGGLDTTVCVKLLKEEYNMEVITACVGVSTRRLEEEGLYTLLKQYGKSTYNDFRGKRTKASDLNYNFGHESTKLLENKDENRDSENNNNNNNNNIIISNENNLDNKSTNERKKIFYSICGEGMGHAIRSGVILEELTKKHEVYIFSSDRAYQYLDSKFDNVFEIGGFNTVYENNTVNNTKTFLKALKTNPTNLKWYF